MKKMMFNDRYGLTQAVIEGRKTMTRRIVDPKSKYEKLRLWQPCLEMEYGLYGYTDNDGWVPIKPHYFVGETVAVAQSYQELDNEWCRNHIGVHSAESPYSSCENMAGWKNKMFVQAEACKHQIHIKDLRIERLQDIPDDDCIREGVQYIEAIETYYFERKDREEGFYFDSLREAFASLIDKISGKGTWERNPFVWRIEFKLVK